MRALCSPFKRAFHCGKYLGVTVALTEICAAPAYAQVPDVSKTKREPDQLNIAIGLGVVKLPKTLGGQVFPVPYVDLNYKDFFTFNFDTASLYWRQNEWEVGATAGYAFGRQENDLQAFRGLGNIRPTLSGGAYVTRYWGQTAQVSLSYNRDLLNRGQGSEIRLEAIYGLRLSPRWLVSAGPTIGWADREHMQTFYGVTADQSVNSGRAQYSPNGGIETVGISFNTYYAISKQWSVGGAISIDRLLGDAKNSPITQAIGSPTQVTGFVGVTYHWK